MPRFILKRLLAFILALGLVSFALAAHSRPVIADTTTGIMDGDAGGGGSAIGDPDVPTTPGKSKLGHGVVVRPMEYGAVSAGDGSAPARAWMIRLRVALQSLRMRWLGI